MLIPGIALCTVDMICKVLIFCEGLISCISIGARTSHLCVLDEIRDGLLLIIPSVIIVSLFFTLESVTFGVVVIAGSVLKNLIRTRFDFNNHLGITISSFKFDTLEKEKLRIWDN